MCGGQHGGGGPLLGVAVHHGLHLQPRHVHPRRALGGARAARQAEVQRLGQPGVGQAQVEIALDGGAQQHRAPARGVPLIAQCLVRRAHHGVRPAALAVAIAGLGRALQAAGGVERDGRADVVQGGGGLDAQALIERLGVGDDSRVEDALGIERALHRVEAPQQVVVVHAWQQLAAKPAVAVLARKRPAVCGNDVGNRLGHPAHLRRRPRRAQVDHGPDVQAAHARVAVPDGVTHALVVEYPAHLAGERRQLLGRHRRVLDEGDGLLIALGAKRAGDAGAPDGPHGRLVGRVGDDRGTGQRPGPPGCLAGLAGVLDHEQRGRLAHDAEQRALGRLPVGRVHQRGVHELDGGRPGADERRHGIERGVDIGEGHDGQRAFGGDGQQAHHRAAHHRERALAAREERRPVGRGPHEPVEGVARHPAHEPGEALVGGERPCGLERRGRLAPLREGRLRAVGEHDVELHEVVGGHAVHDRPGARGVVADHPAERRPAAGGHVGAEHQAVRPRRAVEVVEHHARPHAGRHGGGVHLDSAQSRAVDHQAAAHRLAGEARARTPHGEGDVVPRAGVHGQREVVLVRGEQGPHGHPAVEAGVHGVELARGGVATHVTPGLAGEIQQRVMGVIHAPDAMPDRSPKSGLRAAFRVLCSPGSKEQRPSYARPSGPRVA